jgi:hypothetical protein
VHTDVVWVVVSWAARIQSTIGPPSRATFRVIIPPGTSSTSGVGTSSRVWTMSNVRRPLSSGRRPFCSAQTTISAPGRLLRTW